MATRAHYIKQMVDMFVRRLQILDVLDEELMSQLTNPANLPLLVPEYDAFLEKVYSYPSMLEELCQETKANKLAAALRNYTDCIIQPTGNTMMISGFEKLADAIDTGDVSVEVTHSVLQMIAQHLEMYQILMDHGCK